nr:flavodoxin family protein [Desulfobacterales bacterium]
MKVVAFNGSPRKGGNTAQAIQVVLDELEKEGIQTEMIQIGGEPINSCKACFKCAKNKDKHCSVTDDKLNFYIDKILEADGILVGSPTYFSNVSSEVKAFIDRAGMVAKVNGDMYKRKVGAAVVVARRAGATHVFSSINYFFFISQMIVAGSNYWNLGIGLNPGDVKNDKEGLVTFRTLGSNMAWLLRKIGMPT